MSTQYLNKITFFSVIIYIKTKIMIGLKKKKKKTNVEKKETRVDNRGFGFWVEISPNYFFILYMADKACLFFLEKNQRCSLFLPA